MPFSVTSTVLQRHAMRTPPLPHPVPCGYTQMAALQGLFDPIYMQTPTDRNQDS